MRHTALHHPHHARQIKLRIGVDGIASRRTTMTNFVGDNDHGDTFPPAEVLFKEVLELRKKLDEARQMVCRALYTDEEMQRNHARLCGWDCFK